MPQKIFNRCWLPGKLHPKPSAVRTSKKQKTGKPIRRKAGKKRQAKKRERDTQGLVMNRGRPFGVL